MKVINVNMEKSRQQSFNAKFDAETIKVLQNNLSEKELQSAVNYVKKLGNKNTFISLKHTDEIPVIDTWGRIIPQKKTVAQVFRDEQGVRVSLTLADEKLPFSLRTISLITKKRLDNAVEILKNLCCIK